MSCYSVYAPGLGWTGNVGAACSHDAARALYARLPRALYPATVRVHGPGGFVSLAWYEVVVPTLDELAPLVRRAEGEGVRVEAHEHSPALCRVAYPEGHRLHRPGPGDAWVRRLLSPHCLGQIRRRREREASEARRRAAGVVSIPVRVHVEAVRR